MKSLNEFYQPINEDMRFEALSTLRELQSNLVGISFLPVIAIMKNENPLKKSVLKFQDDLDELTISIQEFISKAKNDIDFEEPEGEEPTDDEEIKDDEAEELEDEEEVEKEDEEKEKVVDSSQPKE